MWVDSKNSQNKRERERKLQEHFGTGTNSVKWRRDLLLSEEKKSNELKKRTKEELQQQKKASADVI